MKSNKDNIQINGSNKTLQNSLKVKVDVEMLREMEKLHGIDLVEQIQKHYQEENLYFDFDVEESIGGEYKDLGDVDISDGDIYEV